MLSIGRKFGKAYKLKIIHMGAKLLHVVTVVIVPLLSIAPAWSDTTIETEDGSKYTLPIEPGDIQSIEAAPRNERLGAISGKSVFPNTVTQPNNIDDSAPSPRPSTARAKPVPRPAGPRAAKSGSSQRVPATNAVPTLAELASQIRPGKWLLVPAPISDVLHKREDLNPTTWGSGSRMVVDAWSAWAWDGNCAYLHNGGHADYGGNEVYRFCFGNGWERIIESYILPERTPENPCPKPTAEEHGPPSAHTYDSLIWSPRTNSMFYFNFSGYCRKGYFRGPPMVWEVKDGQWWRRADLDISMNGFGRTALDAHGNIVVVYPGAIRVLDPVLGKYTTSGATTNINPHGSMIHVPELKRYFVLDSHRLLSFDAETLKWRTDFAHSAAIKTAYTTGMAWHTPTRSLVFWNGGREIRIFDPDRKQWQVLPNTDGPAPTGARPLAKWEYVTEHDVFVGLSRHNDGIWLYRLPLNGPPPT